MRVHLLLVVFEAFMAVTMIAADIQGIGQGTVPLWDAYLVAFLLQVVLSSAAVVLLARFGKVRGWYILGIHALTLAPAFLLGLLLAIGLNPFRLR